jgi:hypothetical protein
MRTFTTYREDIADQCNVSTNDTKAMSKIDTYLNDSIRTVCNLQGGKLRFLETTKDMVTVADQETYEIPNSIRKLMDIYLYDGTGASTDTIHSPRVIYDPKMYKNVLQSHLGTSEVPYFVYVQGKQYKIQPIPSTSGNKITLRGRLNTRDLSIADYTTGTIDSITTATTTLTGSGTTWTASMIGRYIQIDDASGGDGFWYEIGAFTSTTVLELVKPYEGTTITGGSATYTIGQTSVIPEAYDVSVVHRSTALWWGNQKDLVRAKAYWLNYDGGKEAGFSDNYGGLINEMLANEGETEEGAYIAPMNGRNSLNRNYYYPWQNGSGF